MINNEEVDEEIYQPSTCYTNQDKYNDLEYSGKKEDELTEKQRFERLLSKVPERIRNNNYFDFERFGYKEEEVKDSKPLKKFSISIRKIKLRDYETEDEGVPAVVMTIHKNRYYYNFAAITLGDNVLFFKETLDGGDYITSYAVPKEVIFMYRDYYEANLATFREKWIIKKLVDRRMKRAVKEVSELPSKNYQRKNLPEHPIDNQLKKYVEEVNSEQ